MGRPRILDYDAINRMRRDGSTLKEVAERYRCSLSAVFAATRTGEIDPASKSAMLYKRCIAVANGKPYTVPEIARVLGIRAQRVAGVFRLFGYPPNIIRARNPGMLKVIALLQSGHRQAEVGRMLGVSRQRVNQVMRYAEAAGIKFGGSSDGVQCDTPSDRTDEQQRRENDTLRDVGCATEEVREDSPATTADLRPQDVRNGDPGAG